MISNEIISTISNKIDNAKYCFYIHSFSSVNLTSEATFAPRMIITGNFKFSNIVDERKRKLEKICAY